MATTTQDDGFHEIQLNGKQLVFLFMAVTVVSVVIFLSGVLVGRGVRGAPVAEVTATTEPVDAAPPVPADSGPRPIVPGEYPSSGDLDKARPGTDKLEPVEEPKAKTELVAESPAKESPAVKAPEPAATPPAPIDANAEKAAPEKPTVAAAAPPSGPGLEIQLSAFRDRNVADALASRVTAMGFSAYVVPPGPGAPALFRVRVGKFKERREAEAAANKLKKEKFTPWILP